MTVARPSNYPLTASWMIAAGLLGTALAVLSNDLLPGYAVFVLIATIGMTWRRHEAPIFAYVLGHQWVAITIGYWYERIVGTFPSAYPTGDINRTITLALTGLLVLAVAIRLTTWVIDRRRRGQSQAEPAAAAIGNLGGLFLLVVAAFGIDYLLILSPRYFPTISVMLERLLDVRHVLLLVLWFEVLRTRRGWVYLWLTLAWAFVPRLGSYYSDFKSPLILLAIALAANWRPWEQDAWKRGALMAFRATPVLALLLFLTLVWQAGVKQETRRAYDLDMVGRDPLDRVSLFVSNARDALPIVFEETQDVVEGLVERLSYITFFSLVLDHVPDREPYAGGELAVMALTNTAVPRFLKPDKPVLPSDSYFTRRFAGVNVADGATSISIGYMAEFYSDWGLRGMMISVFLYGCWIALGAAVIRAVAGPAILVNAVLIVVLPRVAEFEHQFVKGLAAFNVSVIVTLATLILIRPFLFRFIRLTHVKTAADPPAVPAPGVALAKPV